MGSWGTRKKGEVGPSNLYVGSVLPQANRPKPPNAAMTVAATRSQEVSIYPR